MLFTLVLLKYDDSLEEGSRGTVGMKEVDSGKTLSRTEGLFLQCVLELVLSPVFTNISTVANLLNILVHKTWLEEMD